MPRKKKTIVLTQADIPSGPGVAEFKGVMECGMTIAAVETNILLLESQASPDAHAVAIVEQSAIAQRDMKRSIDIETPGPLPLFFRNGGVAEFTGVMECGKTIAQILTVCELVEVYGFPPNRIFSNIWIDIPGVNHLTNTELKKVLRRAFGKDSKELGLFTWCIFVIGEADSLYSHLDSTSKFRNEGADDIWNLSQAYRFNCHVLIEYHEGLGVLKFMRDKTEVGIEPSYNESTDELIETIYNGHYDIILERTIGDASWVFDKYKRFAPVV